MRDKLYGTGKSETDEVANDTYSLGSDESETDASTDNDGKHRVNMGKRNLPKDTPDAAITHRARRVPAPVRGVVAS
jgi:hypothetical protein